MKKIIFFLLLFFNASLIFAGSFVGYSYTPVTVEIERTADSEKVLSRTLQIEVERRYRDTRMVYGTDPICGMEEDCYGTGEHKSCTWKTRSCMHSETYYYYEFDHFESLTINIEIDQNGLIAGEKEFIEIKWYESETMVEIKNARFEYEIPKKILCPRNESTTITIKQLERIIKDPPNSLDITVENDGEFSILIKDTAISANSEIESIYNITIKEDGFFDKKLFNKEYSTLGEEGLYLTDEELGFILEAGKKYFVIARLKRINPEYYKEGWSGELQVNFEYTGTDVAVTGYENEDDKPGKGCFMLSEENNTFYYMIFFVLTGLFLIFRGSKCKLA